MLSIRRLTGIIIVTALVSVLFLIYGINENNLELVLFENEIPEKNTYIRGDLSLIHDNEQLIFYVVGNNKVFNNVIELFDNMKLNYKSSSYINIENVPDNSVVIFTHDIVSKLVSLQKLERYISNGGRVIFAYGMSESTQDSYLNPILGIIEKTIKVNYNEFTIADGFMPFMEENLYYAGFNASTWVDINDNAVVYISDKSSNVPVVYSNIYGNGQVMVINATFLEDKKSLGILTGAIGELVDNFVYPILGAKSIFLDNFPVTNNADDGKCMDIYGRTINLFVKDKMWPVFQGMAARNGLKLTSSILVGSSAKYSLPGLTNNLFYTISKSFMQYDGEVVFAGNFYDRDNLYINEDFCESFAEIFQQYTVNGFAVQFGIFDEAIYSRIIKSFENISIVRGNLTGNENDTYVCDLGKTGDFYTFPVVSNGEDLDDGAMWDIANTVSTQGFISHCFDINVLLGLDDGSKTWNERIKSINDFEGRVVRPLNWLKSNTLSENMNDIDGYMNISYKWKKTDDEIVIVCDNYVENQTFYLRTNNDIKSITGAEGQKISDNYYLLTVEESVIKINLKK